MILEKKLEKTLNFFLLILPRHTAWTATATFYLLMRAHLPSIGSTHSCSQMVWFDKRVFPLSPYHTTLHSSFKVFFVIKKNGLNKRENNLRFIHLPCQGNTRNSLGWLITEENEDVIF